MNSVPTLDAQLVSALEEAVEVLRNVAEYEMEDDWQQRMRVLGENKQACSAKERDEHRQLTPPPDNPHRPSLQQGPH